MTAQLPSRCFKNQSELARYQCQVCDHLLESPVQLDLSCNCWDRLCQKCAVELLKNNPAKCPNKDCNFSLGSGSDAPDGSKLKYFLDRFACKAIDKLSVCCPNECPWDGQLVDLHAHLISCKDLSSSENGVMSHPVRSQRPSTTALQSVQSAVNIGNNTPILENNPVCTPQDLNHTMCVASCQPAAALLASSPTKGAYHVDTKASVFGRIDYLEEMTSALQEKAVLQNHNGKFMWTIPNFENRMSDARAGRIEPLYSSPFYTASPGYKMRMCLYLNGTGFTRESHISLFFVLMRGDFDDILRWPFRQKVTFKLFKKAGEIDKVETFTPDAMNTSVGKPTTDMNNPVGFAQFLSTDELLNGGYIINNEVFIECIVEE